MANHTRVRADLAAWSTGTPVTNSEFDKFDANLVKCPNFADGCSMSPTAAVNVGGTYGMILSATTPCVLNGNTAIGATPSNTLSVSATSTFSGPVTCSGTLTVTGNVALGNAITDTLVVNATTTFSQAVGCSAGLGVTGTISASGTVSAPSVSTGEIATGTLETTGHAVIGSDASDTLTVNAVSNHLASGQLGSVYTNAWELLGTLFAGGYGRLALLYVAVSVSGDGNRAVQTGQFIHYTSMNGADRTETLTGTVRAGDFKLFFNGDSGGNSMTIADVSGVVQVIAAGHFALLICNGTNWIRFVYV